MCGRRGWKVKLARLTAVLVVALMLVGWIALPAMAANVSAECGGGGYFYTKGTADNWQDHTHDGNLWHTWYYGRQYKQYNWGFEAGTEYGTVDGPNLSGAGAMCPV